MERVREIVRRQKEGSFFLYDIDALEAHLQSLAMPGLRLWYACKANPLSSVIQSAVRSGFGIDCASTGELRQALRSGASAENILLTGPGKTPAFFREAIRAGVETFVLESHAQAETLEAEAKSLGLKVNALLRLQLSWNSEEASVLGGSATTAFGLDAAQWKLLPPLAHVEITGVHSFQWGNLLSAERLGAIWQRVAREALSLAQEMNFRLQILDLGGGLGIPYHGETPLAWSAVQSQLRGLQAELPGTELWLELGRYAVGEFGFYASSVVDRKQVTDREFIVLEGGSQHLLRPALVKDPFPAKLLRKSIAAPKDFSVHGPLCTALDHLGTLSLPSDIVAGDWLVFSQTGAYGFTESMPFFLCHPGAAEWIFHKGELSCLRPVEEADTWLV